MQPVNNIAVEKHIITWQQYDKDIRKLARQLQQHIETKNSFRYIAGVARGGVVCAVHLSHLLNIPYLSRITPLMHSRLSIIVVDELVDTGKTLKLFSGFAATATLYRKDCTKFEPTYCVRTINAWVQFPWEM